MMLFVSARTLDQHHIFELFINNANQLYVFLRPDRKLHSHRHSQGLARRLSLASFCENLGRASDEAAHNWLLFLTRLLITGQILCAPEQSHRKNALATA